MTIPDEAVQAASEIICAHDNAQWGDSGTPDMYHDLVGKMLTAAQPFLTGVKVQALGWKQEDTSYWRAKSDYGCYGINKMKEGYFEMDGDIYADLEAAKAAAQADYEARILPAIEVAPSPRAQALEEGDLLKRAALIIEGRSTAVNSEFIESLSNRKAWEVAEIIADNDIKLGAEIRAISSQPVADGCKTEREQALEKALKPFSDIAGELFAMNYNESDVVFTVHRKTPKGSKISTSMTFKAFNNARAALPASPGASE